MVLFTWIHQMKRTKIYTKRYFFYPGIQKIAFIALFLIVSRLLGGLKLDLEELI